MTVTPDGPVAGGDVDTGGRAPVLAVLTFSLLFFLSGFAALVYQVVWQRLLTFFGGADVYSITIIVSAFMGGLGFGSLAGGYLADRLRPRASLVAFAVCETAVGAFALFSTNIYYDVLYVRLGEWDPGDLAIAAIIFGVTLWPTFFMGVSLPLLSRALAQDQRWPAHWVPFLYGSNTLGAACGSLLAVAVLFRAFDFPTSIRVGAVLSFVCAVGGLLGSRLVRQAAPRRDGIARGASTDRRVDQQADAGPPPAGFGLRAWVAIYALSGFIALSLEILWFRILGVILKANSFTFGHLLAIYLLGVGLGALLVNHRRIRSWSSASAFFLLQSAIPVVATVSIVVLVAVADRVGPLWQYLGQYEPLSREAVFGGTHPELFLILYVAVPAVLLGPATLMMGLSFGFLQMAVQTDLASLGRRVGWLQTANIVGSMCGALLTGVVLLDWVGSAGTLRLLLCCTTVFVLLYRSSVHSRRVRTAAIVANVAILAFLFVMPSAATLWARLHGSDPSQVLQAEDASGVSLLKASGAGTIVHANGLGQSTLPYGGTHTVLGSLPALIHPNPRSVAVIGLGSGDTVFAAGGRAETVLIESIEIIAAERETLLRLRRDRDYPGLRMLLEDGRVRFRFTDGRAFLKKGQQRYDIIEADALRPTSAYAGNLYSVEYFELLRSRLHPQGLAVTWAPTQRVVDGLVLVFPHVLLFGDVAIGSMAPVPFDPVVTQARMKHPFTREYDLRGGIDIEELLAGYVNKPPVSYGPELARSALVDVNRDMFPKDEFAVGP